MEEKEIVMIGIITAIAALGGIVLFTSKSPILGSKLAVNLTSSSTSVPSNSSVTITAKATGGTPPYTYSFYQVGNNAPMVNTSNSFAFAFNGYVGTTGFYVVVTDSAGNDATSNTVNVISTSTQPKGSIVAPSINTSSNGLTGTVNINNSNSTIMITTQTVNWGDNTTPQTLQGNATSAVHTYSQNGTYTITVYVFDAYGDSAFSTANITVSAVPPQTSYGYVQGQVLNTDTNQPVPGVSIIIGNQYTATTNSQGYYAISNVVPGTYNLIASASGYTINGAQVTVVSGAISGQNLGATPTSSGASGSGSESSGNTSGYITVSPTTINSSPNTSQVVTISGYNFAPGEKGYISANNVQLAMWTADSNGTWSVTVQNSMNASSVSGLWNAIQNNSGSTMGIYGWGYGSGMSNTVYVTLS